jgi:diguanylate cyclase (GGDEF)-like protein
MYDPLIVDTFARVYERIIPSSNDVPKHPSLLAITGASQHTELPQAPAQRFDEIAASTEEMLTLLDLATGLTSLMSLPDVADSIWRHLRRLVPSSLCVFFLYDIESDELVAVHAAGDSASLIQGIRIGLGQRLSGWVAANRRTIVNSDPLLDFGETARAISPRPRSSLSTPLVAGSELIGVLAVYSAAPNAFSDEHQRIIEVIGRQVAPIIRRSAEVDGKPVGSPRDRVTGLPMVEHIRQWTALSRVAYLQKPSSLLFIDVDDLAGINRRHGRGAGDNVLVNVVAIARKYLRGGDLLFRHGNDEFVALLLQTDLPTAQAMGVRIQNAAKSSGTIPVQFTLTVAVLSLSEDETSVDDLITRARAAISRSRSGSLLPGPTDSIH